MAFLSLTLRRRLRPFWFSPPLYITSGATQRHLSLEEFSVQNCIHSAPGGGGLLSLHVFIEQCNERMSNRSSPLQWARGMSLPSVTTVWDQNVQ